MIRGLHYHVRGQDDLFACLQGTASVVVLDRDTGETFSEDIGDENPVALYIPGRHAHGFEALTDLLFCYHVTEEYDPADPDEHGIPWDDPRVTHLWSTRTPILSSETRRRVLITGAGGQLGGRSPRRSRDDDVAALERATGTFRCRPPAAVARPDLVLHAAAWTDVDGAEADPQGAAAVNVGGAAHAAELGAPLVTFSTDYVFDGDKRTPYVESDGPSPQSVYGSTKLHGEALRASGHGSSAPRGSSAPTGHNFVRTMLRLGAERDEVAVVDDQRGCPTYVGHLAAATKELVDARLHVRDLAPRRRRRLHVGGLRRGDLRGGRHRLPGTADHERRAGPPGGEARLLRPAQRAPRRSGAPALARRPARLPGAAGGPIAAGLPNDRGAGTLDPMGRNVLVSARSSMRRTWCASVSATT